MSSLTHSRQNAPADNSAAVKPELQFMKAANLLVIMFCGWFFLTFLYGRIHFCDPHAVRSRLFL
ncbi:MAG: hypothetical protein GY826_39945 [Fuerstiella sp.]|nr:hypothetical protein [Fuerstiella sp.]